MSVSSRISCTLGGGSAIARDTAPKSGGAHFRLCENVYCGLSLQINSTTLYPEDLKWQPRLVSVDFILMQNALSKPLYAFVLDRDITDETSGFAVPTLELPSSEPALLGDGDAIPWP